MSKQLPAAGTLSARLGPPAEQLRTYYNALFSAWGPQHWWPAHSRFEVVVGAYLTQNTSWKNVEIVLRRLRSAGVLSLDGIRKISASQLENLIRPAGYFRQKAARLKIFVRFVDKKFAGSLTRMFAQPAAKLREELLALNGVGPETADSILLYAGQRPVFVVDAYTRRILVRHGLIAANAPYDEIRELCERSLSDTVHLSRSAELQVQDPSTVLGHAHPPSRMSRARRSSLAQIYNDMHGLIVNVGKHYCLKSTPRCDQCPLRPYLP